MITVRITNVVMTMHTINGKGRFSGTCSSQTLRFSKIGTIDYVGDLTQHVSPEINPKQLLGGSGGLSFRVLYQCFF